MARPEAVKLTPEEQELADQIPWDGGRVPTPDECERVFELTKSLAEHEAFPDVRLRYFTDPEMNACQNKSRQEVFESNGTKGEDIYRHGNFIRHLRYMIYQPVENLL